MGERDLSRVFGYKLLKEIGGVEEGFELLKKGNKNLWFSGCTDTQKVQLFSGIPMENEGWKLVVTYDEIRAREIWEDFCFFCPNALMFPAKDAIFFSADINSGTLTWQRMKTIRTMMEEKGGVIVTTVDGLMNLLPPLDALMSGILEINMETEVDLGKVTRKLVNLGYTKEVNVEAPGQFAVRGGILDIYGVTHENPVRIELWGDSVDDIRIFDVESQRSIEKLQGVTIYPASENYVSPDRIAAGLEKIEKELDKQLAVFRKEKKFEAGNRLTSAVHEFMDEAGIGAAYANMGAYFRYFYPAKDAHSILDYLPENTLLCLDEPDRLRARAEAVELEFTESMKNRLEQGYLLPGQTQMLLSSKEIFGMLGQFRQCIVSGLEYTAPFLQPKGKETPYQIMVGANATASYRSNFELLLSDLNNYNRQGWRVVIVTGSRTRGERQAESLREQGLNAFYSEECESLKPGQILVTYGSLHKGFSYPAIRFCVLTQSDLDLRKKEKKRKKSQYRGQSITSFTDLVIGDYVVHENYGLGEYRGIVNKNMDGESKDYISILYGDGGTLYIPATNFHLIQKYASSEAEKKPKLNRLDSQEWRRTKSRVKSAVDEIATELVELYAKRQNGKGFRFDEDTVWQREFEEMFPFEETGDQLDAIRETKQDMESDKIMDRLICGDVGYGKTEIAIRAAFKSVMSGKQVVLLCPTTILAQQHYNTFVRRMQDFAVRVDLLCRFRTAGQQKKTLEDARKGQVDIIIGTHRLLSRDVRFKDLGLLIVDEEQRFGVTHKEKIKVLKENIDVLTLTATPIPRTLHMSLIGVRDMSVLEEGPQDRLPIQTYVMEQNPEMIREAINREIARNGQVYYVYNKVKDIASVAAKIQDLVPDAVVSYAHGQMSEHTLEGIMLDFINGDIDVLVTTTIIETGLDISNVNTIIIHDSDRFGLSQLYQLRGRVGRSNRTAYAFVMYSRNKMLSEVAEKRLTALRENTELGSGIRIAMKDLEIRGAGNILGKKQHGHIEAVGYDLYCKMLSEAVAMKKGDEPEQTFDTSVDLKISAYIPDEYIANEGQKLDIYKRIAGIENEDEAGDMRDELIDRFGEPPVCVENLLQISMIRKMAHDAFVTAVAGGMKQITLTMTPMANVNMDRLMILLSQYRNMLSIKGDGDAPVFTLRLENVKSGRDRYAQILEILKKLLIDIKLLLD